MKVINQTEDRLLNGVAFMLGIILLSAPWFFAFTSETFAAANAWICGSVVALLGLMALRRAYDWQEYISFAIGLWLIVAPWALGFVTSHQAMGIHVLLGVCVAVITGFELYRLNYSTEARSVHS